MLYKIKTDEVCGFINLPLPLGLLELKDNQAEVDIDPTVADRLKALGKISGFSVECLVPEEPEKEIPKEIEKEIPKEIEKEIPKEIEKEIPKEVEKEIPKEVEVPEPEKVPEEPEKSKKESKTKEVVDKPKRNTRAKSTKGRE